EPGEVTADGSGTKTPAEEAPTDKAPAAKKSGGLTLGGGSTAKTPGGGKPGGLTLGGGSKAKAPGGGSAGLSLGGGAAGGDAPAADSAEKPSATEAPTEAEAVPSAASRPADAPAASQPAATPPADEPAAEEKSPETQAAEKAPSEKIDPIKVESVPAGPTPPPAAVKFVKRFLARHGGEANLVLQPTGRTGVRLTFVGADGVMDDYMVDTLAEAEAVRDSVPGLTGSDWTRELVSNTDVPAGHWKRMAGSGSLL
ncbi:hypothetical protein, partial [Dietzia psychralcaliphila]